MKSENIFSAFGAVAGGEITILDIFREMREAADEFVCEAEEFFAKSNGTQKQIGL